MQRSACTTLGTLPAAAAGAPPAAAACAIVHVTSTATLAANAAPGTASPAALNVAEPLEHHLWIGDRAKYVYVINMRVCTFLTAFLFLLMLVRNHLRACTGSLAVTSAENGRINTIDTTVFSTFLHSHLSCRMLRWCASFSWRRRSAAACRTRTAPSISAARRGACLSLLYRTQSCVRTPMLCTHKLFLLCTSDITSMKVCCMICS